MRKTLRYRKKSLPQPRGRAARHHGMAGILPIAALAVVFVLGMLYVSQVNASAAGAVTVNRLERALIELKTENQELEIRAAALRSVGTVQQNSGKLHLVVKAEPDRLPPASAAVAVAR